MSASLKLDGLEQINEKLKALGGKVANKVSRDAVREGAKVIRKEMRAGAPKGNSGELRKNIRYRIRGRKGNFNAKVGISKKIYYAWFIEYGTSAHQVPSENLGRGRNKRKNDKKIKINGEVYSKAKHPGIKPNPFMRRAWERSKTKSYESMKHTLWKRISQENNRI